MVIFNALVLRGLRAFSARRLEVRRRQVLGVVVGLVSLLKLSSWHLRARISESNAEVILP